MGSEKSGVDGKRTGGDGGAAGDGSASPASLIAMTATSPLGHPHPPPHPFPATISSRLPVHTSSHYS